MTPRVDGLVRPPGGAERRIDQVDWSRIAVALHVLSDLVEMYDAPTHVFGSYYDSDTPWSAIGGQLRESEELDSQDGILGELEQLVALVERLRRGFDTVEVLPSCVAALQAAEGPPAKSWERWCQTCRAVHQFAGHAEPEHWGMLPVPVLGMDEWVIEAGRERLNMDLTRWPTAAPKRKQS